MWLIKTFMDQNAPLAEGNVVDKPKVCSTEMMPGITYAFF